MSPRRPGAGERDNTRAPAPAKGHREPAAFSTLPLSSLQVDPQNANREGRIIAGNKTLERARELGMADVLVIATDGSKIVAVQRTDLDLACDPRARALAYADNRIAELDLDWNVEQLLLDIENELTRGLEDDRGDDPPRDDEAEALRAKWGTAEGQLWQLGEHRLICGDSTDTAVITRLLNGAKPELVITDPRHRGGRSRHTETARACTSRSPQPQRRRVRPVSGSGMTVIAAEQLHRKAYCAELSPAYTAVIIERWHRFTSQTPLLPKILP